MEHVYNTYKDPSSMPDISTGPKYDQLKGFPNGRRKKVTIVSEDEMFAAGFSPHQRDYCAHILMSFRKCRAENVLTAIFCQKERHAYLECQQSEQLLRMKEYERERRLIAKEKQNIE